MNIHSKNSRFFNVFPKFLGSDFIRVGLQCSLYLFRSFHYFR